jgi:acyl carrier protein
MKNIDIIAEILETKKSKINKNSKLEEYIWDSMSQIKLLTYLSSKQKKQVNVEKIKKIKTILELDNFINSEKKK